MSQSSRILTAGLIVFVLTTIITSATTIYYYQEYNSVNQKYIFAQQNYTSLRKSVIRVSLAIDYGNGTVNTYDPLYLAPNTSVLDALKAVANVNATYWPEFQAWFINAINNVYNNENNNNRWWIYSVNGEHASIGAEAYKIKDGDQIEWRYQKY